MYGGAVEWVDMRGVNLSRMECEEGKEGVCRSNVDMFCSCCNRCVFGQERDGERERVKETCFLLHFATLILLFAFSRLRHLLCLFVWVLECLLRTSKCCLVYTYTGRQGRQIYDSILSVC